MVAIQGFDRHGLIHHWNSACERLYGFTAAEAVGRRLQDILLSEPAAREFEVTLEEVWRSAEMRHWRALIPPLCADCIAFAQCRGGCRAMALACDLERDPLMPVEPLREVAH